MKRKKKSWGGGLKEDANEDVNFCENSKKFFFFWGGGGGGRGGRGGCERRSEALVKNSKKNWGGGGGFGPGGGGCEQRSEAFVKIKKKFVFWGVGGRGVRLGGGGSGWM